MTMLGNLSYLRRGGAERGDFVGQAMELDSMAAN
jgi:hypothetical protein